MAELAAEAALAFQRMHPRAFFERFVAQAVRPDGRGLLEARPTRVLTGAVKSADGSARVELGDTSVVCGVRYMVAPLDSGTPQVRVRAHLLPVSSPRFEYGTAAEAGAALAAFLGRVVTGAEIIDAQDLEIAGTESVFVLEADVVCLSDDGNLEDAALRALVAALEDLRLPEVRLEDAADRGVEGAVVVQRRVVEVADAARRRLALCFRPVPATFGIFGDELLLDPTREELEVMDGTATVVLADGGSAGERDVVSVLKPDGRPLSQAELAKCLDAAAKLA